MAMNEAKTIAKERNVRPAAPSRLTALILIVVLADLVVTAWPYIEGVL